MAFAQIKGNENVAAALRGMVDGARVPHAMLFFENPASGGMAMAQAFLQYLYCTGRKDGDACGVCPSCRKIAAMVHPDVHYVFPVNEGEAIRSDHPVSSMGMESFRSLYSANPYFTEDELYAALGMGTKSGNISVYEAREIISSLSLSSVEGGYRTVVMFLPERMNQAAANKLLKLLEEPPAQTLFILITQNPEDVMGTIYSRCQGLRIIPFDRSSIYRRKVGEDMALAWKSMLEAVISGNLSEALDSADAVAGIKSRDAQKAFCSFAAGQIRQIFLRSRNLADIAYIEDSDHLPEADLSSGFCISALSLLDKAAFMLGRNVSAKMVFTDLVNRLFLNFNDRRQGKQTI